jgi:3-methyladenine DNA glycosylase AlkD
MFTLEDNPQEGAMATLDSVIAELKKKGTEKNRKTYARHGMDPDRLLGVSVADLKVIAKTIKRQQELACALYETGIMDAMYLAGMVADGSKLPREQLSKWVESAGGLQMISEYTIPWLTVENPHGRALAVEWIGSKREHIATSGWCSYSGLLAITPDEKLDLAEIEKLLAKIQKEIHSAQNRVRHTMNNFIIAVGTYVKPLANQAKATAAKIGNVSVDMGDTACKVPLATSYIEKAEATGKVGVKKKTIRC